MTQNKKIIKIKKLLVRVFEQLSDSKVAVVNMCVLVNEFEIVRSVYDSDISYHFCDKSFSFRPSFVPPVTPNPDGAVGVVCCI